MHKLFIAEQAFPYTGFQFDDHFWNALFDTDMELWLLGVENLDGMRMYCSL